MNPGHFYLATDGVGPGMTHYTFSVLGRRVNVTITPIPPTQSDPGGGGWIPDVQRYEVTVTIEFKGKTWTESRDVGAQGLKSLEKVVAVFKGLSQAFDNVSMFVSLTNKKIMDFVRINITQRK